MKKQIRTVLIFGIIVLLSLSLSVVGSAESRQNICLSQNTGFNNEIVTLTITGLKFSKKVEVKLTKPGEADIIAEQVTVDSKTQITCSLDLRAKALGSWDVTIINKNKFLCFKNEKSVVLAEGFSIKAPPLPVLALNRISPTRGFNNGSILVTFQGKNFDQGTVAYLSNPDQVAIPGEFVHPDSSSQMTCLFDLNQKPPGKYDLNIVDSHGQKIVTPEIFLVEVLARPVWDLNRDLKPIFFDLDQAAPGKDQLTRLDYNLTILNSNPNLYILIGGHTDERGSEQYNLRLSTRRAEAIKQYLIERGIAQERITIYAYGKDYPVKTGHEEIAWKVNRRTDIFVWETPPTKELGMGTWDGGNEIP
ncbi:MAG TPA: OmpA family protein [Bacillota bacterium]|nr:OmpA family protein [Bacillota bacterium]